MRRPAQLPLQTDAPHQAQIEALGRLNMMEHSCSSCEANRYRFDTMQDQSVKHLTVSGLTFSFFTPEEIEKLSVLKITTPLSFNSIGHPLKCGLYDPALGPVSDSSDPCTTCSNNVYKCPGHIGHIELPLPVINSLFHKVIYNILKLACLNCHNFRIKGVSKHLFVTKLRLLDDGLITEAQEVEEVIADLLSSSNPTNVVNEATTVLVEERLQEYYSRMKKKKNVQKPRSRTKFVEFIINDLVNAVEKSVNELKACPNCKAPMKKISMYRNKLMIKVQKASTETERNQASSGINRGKFVTTVILPDESRTHLRKLWQNEKNFMCALLPVLEYCDTQYPTDALFLTVIPVPPPKMRPVNFINDKIIEHPQSKTLKAILQDSIIVQHVMKAVRDGNTENLTGDGQSVVEDLRGTTLEEKLHFAWDVLQIDVNNLMDNDMDKAANRLKIPPGLKQIIEKKEGIIRMHMMGKRVNYAARSVITPDPCLNIDEIGLPEEFAKCLTYPVPVTGWNVAELQNMVLNGPNKHPGAVMVQNEDGSVIRLSAFNSNQRESVAKRLLTPSDSTHNSQRLKVVHRHLCNGDVLLLNRQPTLHRPSIMAHTARILKGEKTIRLHYANCKAYNADFDGDEMNAHFPQNEVARSEAYNILSVNNQYLVPKDGTPLSGLIQDHIVAGVLLSIRGRFFVKEEYQQLVFQGLGHQKGEIKLLSPAILKPAPLWSGKQIISTIIINNVPKGQHPLTLTSSSKVSDQAWAVKRPRSWKAGGTPFTDPKTMSEAEVIIRDGELLCGVLDKAHYGATPYSLIHCMFELYGGTYSGALLNSFAKLFNAFLKIEGFSLGVEDILVVDAAEKWRSNIIRDARNIGDTAVKTALNLPETTSREEMNQKMDEVYQDKAIGRAIIDGSYKNLLDDYTNKVNRACIPGGLLKRFPRNNLQLMIQTGAKGSAVNAMQISCLLGQIELEGKRPPHMASGKALPSFPRYDTSPRAGGFVDGRFMTGIKPQEFFFHCMAGREGLIDTAVKTSRSGYLQRCLVKHLEGLVVHYDMTVRDSDGTVVQFAYGEDGKDVMKAQFLKKKQIPFLADNYKVIKNFSSEMLDDEQTTADIAQRKKQIRKWKKKNGNPFQKHRISPFLLFSADMKDHKVYKGRKLNKETGRPRFAETMCKLWRESDTDTIETYNYKALRCADPVSAEFQGDRDFGAITEKLDSLMDEYLKERHSCRKSEFRHLMSVKSMLSHVHPGEPVGLLAAQSIGEPSTQMTLNTFHFAGRGEMNVTLGIPRLRELLMTASHNMKTPNMDIPFLPDIRKLEKKANNLKLKLCRVTMSDVLQYIDVKDKIELFPERNQVYMIHMQFLPREVYKSKFSVKPAEILKHVEKKFLKEIFYAMKKILKIKATLIESAAETAEKSFKNEDDETEMKLEDEVDPDFTRKIKNAGIGEEHESSDEDEGLKMKRLKMMKMKMKLR
ncbi:DNA-directed RNA polymerase I subunit RPA1-like isoform X6 [Periplaneta americana]|uniref:DNA-directed RNA polymerase I subunit RPA1-like isoform X6 n=1 Tax=Periplaneta americana TaxID=6978 RepID=UPI0037E8F1AD